MSDCQSGVRNHLVAFLRAVSVVPHQCSDFGTLLCGLSDELNLMQPCSVVQLWNYIRTAADLFEG